MKKWLSKLVKDQSGQAFPVILAMLVVGSLIIPPAMNLVSSSLKTGEVVEENVEALYAADAGVEWGVWKLRYETPDFSHNDNWGPYAVTDSAGNPVKINGFDAYVTISLISQLAGEETRWEIGTHNDDLVITKSSTYDPVSELYTITVTMYNTPAQGSSSISIGRIFLEFPLGFDYEPGTTDWDFVSDNKGTLIVPFDPQVNGDPGETGVTLSWEFGNKGPMLDDDITYTMTFQMSGPEGVHGTTGFIMVEATRQDVGTVSDMYPYRITSEAKDNGGVVQARIVAGIWQALSDTYVRMWHVNP